MAANGAGIVNDANKLYNEGEYEKAFEKYKEAEEKIPESDIIGFNKGAALYKKKEFDESLESFSGVLVTEDPELEAKANYNIGNIKYRQAKSSETTKEGSAKRLYNESLDYYKRAIELDESDIDAKYNYEFVKREMKEFKEKQEQPPPKQEQQQENKQNQDQQQQQQQQNQKQKEREQKEKEQEQQEQQQQQQEQEQQQGEEPPQGGAEEERDEKSEPREPREERDEMSEQQARMLLEGYRQQEEPEVKLERERTRYRVLRDW
jgi:hypothetical protein